MQRCRFLILSGWLAFSACMPGTIEDTGVEDTDVQDAGVDDAEVQDAGLDDAGSSDAGSSDAGADAGCSTLRFYLGYHGPAPRIGPDGVVGVESSASAPVGIDFVNNTLFTNRPLPMHCLSASVTGPSGQRVAARFTQLFETSLTVQFTPDEVGDWSVRVAIANGQTRTLTVPVFRPGGPPQLSIAPRCDRLCTGAAVVGCEDRLYRWDGGLIAQLDGGTWICSGTQLFAWQGGALSRAEPGPPVLFSQTIAAPRPVWWSVSDELLMLADSDLGAVIAIDGGLQTVATFTPPVAISGLLAMRGGVPIVLERSGGLTDRACKPSGGCLPFDWSLSNRPFVFASADRDGFWVARGLGSFGISPVWTRFNLLADGGVGAVDVGPSRLNEREALSWRGPNRQPLFDTVRGVRRADGGVMHLPGALEIGATDEAVWQSAIDQTAFWR